MIYLFCTVFLSMATFYFVTKKVGCLLKNDKIKKFTFNETGDEFVKKIFHKATIKIKTSKKYKKADASIFFNRIIFSEDLYKQMDLIMFETIIHEYKHFKDKPFIDFCQIINILYFALFFVQIFIKNNILFLMFIIFTIIFVVVRFVFEFRAINFVPKMAPKFVPEKYVHLLQSRTNIKKIFVVNIYFNLAVILLSTLIIGRAAN